MIMYTDRELNMADIAILAIAIVLTMSTMGLIVSHSRFPTPDSARDDMLFAIGMMLLTDILCILPHSYIGFRRFINEIHRNREHWESKGYRLWNEEGLMDKSMMRNYITPPGIKDRRIRAYSFILLLLTVSIAFVFAVSVSEYASGLPSMMYMFVCLIPAMIIAVGIWASIFIRNALITHYGTVRILGPTDKGAEQ